MYFFVKKVFVWCLFGANLVLSPNDTITNRTVLASAVIRLRVYELESTIIGKSHSMSKISNFNNCCDVE